MSSLAEGEVVENYRFQPADLRPNARLPGISLFMRVRNGADFLEAAIRSHIGHVDEIVAVHNQCTDATPEILARLAKEFGPERLRVFHYLPAVFPPGSKGHAKESPDSPRSLVNYYNFALTRTRFQVAAKLDDDHLAIKQALRELTQRIRAGVFGDEEMVCFSGLNIARDADGKFGILAREPISGSGDIGFFRVSRRSYYTHSPRFERFNRDGLKRRFAGFVYWHLKYLKPEFGFANYDLDSETDSRYLRKKEAFLRDRRVVDPSAVMRLARPVDRLALAAKHIGIPVPEKIRLRADRWSALPAIPAGQTLRQTIESSSLTYQLFPFEQEL